MRRVFILVPAQRIVRAAGPVKAERRSWVFATSLGNVFQGVERFIDEWSIEIVTRWEFEILFLLDGGHPFSVACNTKEQVGTEDVTVQDFKKSQRIVIINKWGVFCSLNQSRKESGRTTVQYLQNRRLF